MIPSHPHLKLVTLEFVVDSGVPKRSIRIDWRGWDETVYIDARCKRRYKRKLIRQRRRVRGPLD